MKLNLNSILGFFFGALFTFLLVFFFKPFSLSTTSSHNKDTNNLVVEEPAIQAVTSTKNSQNSPKGCDDKCVLDVVERLVSGTNLSNKLGPNIRNIEGTNVAAYLESNTEVTAKIETTLETIKGQNDRDSIIYVFSQLPVEQSFEIAQRLTKQDNRKAQLDGLYLIQNASKNGMEVKTALEEIITHNKDIQVVLQAISIMATTHPTEFESISSAHLNKIIADTNNENDRGKALITKVKLFKTNNTIKNDIINALTSDSIRLQNRAIQALEHILYQQNKGRVASDWRSDTSLQETLNAIANDINGDRRNRAEVLNLMVRYY